MNIDPVNQKQVMDELERRLADYFELVASMLRAGAMSVESYNSEATNDPTKPNRQSASLRGMAMGIDHRLTFNACAILDPMVQLLQKIRIST